MRKYVLITIAILIPPQVSAAKHPSVKELLEKYAKTQDQFKSFIVKYETTSKSEGARHGVYKEIEIHTAIELRLGSRRADRRSGILLTVIRCSTYLWGQLKEMCYEQKRYVK